MSTAYAAALQTLYAYYAKENGGKNAYLAIEKLAYQNSRLPEEWESIRGDLIEMENKYPAYADFGDLKEFSETVNRLLTATESDADDLDTAKAALDEFQNEKRALITKWSKKFPWEGSGDVSRAPLRDPAALAVLSGER